MKKNSKNFFITTLLFMLVTLNLFSQQAVNQEIAMADQMRADGKIWVVFTVISVIFVGIIAFLVNIDRKVSKLEKQKSVNK
jgi:uncharacterized membrane protein